MIKNYLEKQFKSFFDTTSGYVTPEMFGAKGDGETDDSEAFLKACTKAVSTRKYVKLSKRYYLAQEVTVPDYVNIMGTATCTSYNTTPSDTSQEWKAKKNMNITAPNGFKVGSYVNFKNVGFTYYGIEIGGIRVCLDNCAFSSIDGEYNYDAPKTNAAAIILMPNYDGLKDANWRGEISIRNCFFANCTIGVSFHYVTKDTYKLVWEGNKSTKVDVKNSDGTIKQTTSQYTDSEFVGNIVVHGTTWLRGCTSGCFINNNHIYTKGTCISITGQDLLINNNYFDNNDLNVFLNLFQGGQASLSNNLFFSSYAPSDWADKKDTDGNLPIITNNRLINVVKVQNEKKENATQDATLVMNNNLFTSFDNSNQKHRKWRYALKVMNSTIKVDFKDNEFDNIHGVYGYTNKVSGDVEMNNNLFDFSLINSSKLRSTTVGSDINALEDVGTSGGVKSCSKQVFTVKKGDKIYFNNYSQFFNVLFYDENNKLVSIALGDGNATNSISTTFSMKITNEKIVKFTIQGYNWAIQNLMLSINEPIFNNANVPFGKIVTEDTTDKLRHDIVDDGRTSIKKGFICLTFDAWQGISKDTRWAIMNECGLKGSIAMGAGASSYPITKSKNYLKGYRNIINNGWGAYYYCNAENGITPNDLVSENFASSPSATVQARWDKYVKHMIDYAEHNGIFDLVAWGCRQGKAPEGLKRALAKYDNIKLIRCQGSDANNITRFGLDYNKVTAVPYSFNMEEYDKCYNLLQVASEQKCGFVLTTHELTTKSPSEMSNDEKKYQLTETKFREFINKAMEYVNNGTLEFITVDELYARYYPNDAKKIEKRRTLKMIDYMEKEHEAVEEEITNFKTAILSSTDFDDLKSKFQIG